MRQIVYQGHTPEVVVPMYRLTVQAGVPVEVEDHVAEALTEGGASRVWLAVDAKGRPVPPPVPPAPPTEPAGIPLSGSDSETEA